MRKLANRKPFANFLCFFVESILAMQTAYLPIFYLLFGSDLPIHQCFTPPKLSLIQKAQSIKYVDTLSVTQTFPLTLPALVNRYHYLT